MSLQFSASAAQKKLFSISIYTHTHRFIHTDGLCDESKIVFILSCSKICVCVLLLMIYIKSVSIERLARNNIEKTGSSGAWLMQQAEDDNEFQILRLCNWTHTAWIMHLCVYHIHAACSNADCCMCYLFKGEQWKGFLLGGRVSFSLLDGTCLNFRCDRYFLKVPKLNG